MFNHHHNIIFNFQPNASKHDRDDFLSEAAIIGQFTDPNVITLEGVVLKGLLIIVSLFSINLSILLFFNNVYNNFFIIERPNVIVLEYMANGALDKYLQVSHLELSF